MSAADARSPARPPAAGAEPVSDSAAGQGRPDRAIAVARLAALPVIFAGERLVPHPENGGDLFDPILAAAAVYALALFALAWWRPATLARVPGVVIAAIDLGFLVALTHTSGGPFSQLRAAFFLLPVAAALVLPPRLTAAVGATSVIAYLAISLTHPATADREGALDFELAQAFYLAWTGVVATVLSVALSQRTARIRALAASRGRLVAQALDAEDRERRQLAEALHDEAIQNLLAARQELDPGAGDPPDLELARVGLDRTVAQLRDAVFELHPHLLEHAGLAAALRAVAAQQARRGGFEWSVDVAPAAEGVADQIVFSVARELMVNAVKHAGASRLDVAVRARNGGLELEVRDDGKGFDPAAARLAPGEGHIGLASSLERIEAVGGTFVIDAEPGRGATIRATVPGPASA